MQESRSMPVHWVSGQHGLSEKEVRTRSRDVFRDLDVTEQLVNEFNRESWRKELQCKKLSPGVPEKVDSLKSPYRISEELQYYCGDEHGMTSESARPIYRVLEEAEHDSSADDEEPEEQPLQQQDKDAGRPSKRART